MTKYLHLNFLYKSKTGKTSIYGIYNKDNDFLGYIKWNTSWRRYSFFPDFDLVFDANCLQEIINFIKKLMEERKKND